MNLILFAAEELGGDGIVRLRDGRARHLLTVLRVGVGDAVRVGLLDGGRGEARVVDIADGEVALVCTELSSPLAQPEVDLLLALPRPKVLQRLWAQIAAIGVGRIIVTNAARVERHYFDTHVLDDATYRPLLIEGLQQAKDTRVPVVSVHRQFRKLIEDELDGLAPNTTRIVAEPGVKRSLNDAIRPSPSARVLLAVGPEGGWNAFELDLLAAHGFVRVGIGPRSLRSDTACIALLALTHEALRSR